MLEVDTNDNALMVRTFYFSVKILKIYIDKTRLQLDPYQRS